MYALCKLGPAEAAQRLGIPYQNCHRLLLTGVLRGEKRLGRWYVAASDVERLLAAGARNTTDEVHMTAPTKRELEEEVDTLRQTLKDISERIAEVFEDDDHEEYEEEDSDD